MNLITSLNYWAVPFIYLFIVKAYDLLFSVVVKFSGRDAVPSHHLLKVKSFSSLSKAPIEKYCSEFEAGGYKWCVSFDPFNRFVLVNIGRK